jgi:hypothetical protein
MKTIMCLALIFMVTGLLSAKTFHLKDGKTIEGKIYSTNTNSVIIENDSGILVEVPADSIDTNEQAITNMNKMETKTNDSPNQRTIHGSIGVDFGPTLQFGSQSGSGIGLGLELGGTFCSLYLRYAFGSMKNGDIKESIPGAELRFYPGSKNLRGFWIGPSVQLGFVTAKVTTETFDPGTFEIISSTSEESATLLALAGYAGYKIVLGDAIGLSLDPYIGIFIITGDTPKAGLDYGLKLGISF